MKTARADLREAKNRVQLLGVPPEEIDRLDRELTIKADMPLHAPFDGRVITRNITKGEVVETDQKLFTVANLSDVWVIGNVPEKDIRFIRKDQNVNVVLAAYPHAMFSGTITYLGSTVNADNRTFLVESVIANPEGKLKPEMIARVSIAHSEAKRTLLIDEAIVQQVDRHKYLVYVEKSAVAAASV